MDNLIKPNELEEIINDNSPLLEYLVEKSGNMIRFYFPANIWDILQLDIEKLKSFSEVQIEREYSPNYDYGMMNGITTHGFHMIIKKTKTPLLILK